MSSICLKVKKGVNVVPVLIYSGKLTKRVPASGFFARIIAVDELMGLGMEQ